MNSERVDLVLQYALLTAGEADMPFDRDLGPIHLLKYVYIADLAHAEVSAGETFTGAPWIFYNFGPWSNDVHERIKPALAHIQAAATVFQSDFEDRKDWIRWQLQDSRKRAELRSAMPFAVRMALDSCVQRFKRDTPSLLDHVYKTMPMLRAAPSEALDFTPEPQSQSAGTAYIKQELTERRKKKLRQAGLLLRERQALRKATAPKRFVPKPPVHDDVHEQGMMWLDSLAGPSLDEKTLSAQFDDDIWHSDARSHHDLS